MPISTTTSGTRSLTRVAERGLFPLVDIAYQGFGRGLDEDACGRAPGARPCDEVIVAHSCDKNFGCYRDRVGSLFVKTGSREATATAMDHVFHAPANVVDAARSWRGGARIILEDPGLRAAGWSS